MDVTAVGTGAEQVTLAQVMTIWSNFLAWLDKLVPLPLLVLGLFVLAAFKLQGLARWGLIGLTAVLFGVFIIGGN